MKTPGVTEEVQFKSSSGYAALVFALIALLLIPGGAFMRMPLVSVLAVIALIVLVKGVYMLQPNQSALLMLFGEYRGTDYATGLRWANPFMNKTKVSLRLRNFNSEKLKVNDKRGNPIEIAAVVVWRVENTAQAVFDVDDYNDYVHVQSESAIRHLATAYPYDSLESDEVSLRGGIDEVWRQKINRFCPDSHPFGRGGGCAVGAIICLGPEYVA